MIAGPQRLFVEADNAMGSARGDVDDGFALAALLQSRTPLLAIGSVFGNTDEAAADRNNRALAAAMQVPVRHVRGCSRAGQEVAESVEFLVAQQQPLTVLALGPLTTLAAALARRPELPIARL
ncbi:MAG: nucleoside hydrolase, partial [Planctomycetota bacterium]